MGPKAVPNLDHRQTRFFRDLDSGPSKWWIYALFLCMWDVWKLFSIWIAENILQNHKFESTAQEAKACFCLQSRLESLFGFHIGSIPPKMIESSESMPIINIERKSTPKYSILPWSRFGTIFQSKDDHKKKPLLYKKCYSLAPCTI